LVLRPPLVEIPEIIKKDASTSCFDLIDDSNPCNQVLVENIVVETFLNEVAKENNQLKQEVARLGAWLSMELLDRGAWPSRGLPFT
jgi:ribosomal protein L5